MSLRRLWLLAFIGFGLTIGAWAVAAPYDGSNDEFKHVLRAYQVMSGDVAPEPVAASAGTGAFGWGPKNLGRASTCWRKDSRKSAACATGINGPTTLVRFGNAAGRYNPVYYAIVGGPIKLWPTMTGVILARLIGAAMSAALLAAGFVSIVRYSRHRLMLGALLLGASPTAIGMSGAVNPNGVEIAAGIAFFASAIPLLLGAARERPPGWLVCVTAVSAAVLVTVRSGGPIWLALAALALLLPLSVRTVRQLVQPRALRWGVLAVAVASVASVLWIVIMKSAALGELGQPGHLGAGQILFAELQHWPGLTEEMVGVLGWQNIHLLGPAYQLWQLPAAALLLVALVVGSRLDRARLLVVTAGTVGVAAVTEMNGANQVGFVNQGRYLLPVLSGALLLAGWIIEQRGAVTASQARAATRVAVIVTVPIQLHALQMAMVRYQRGIPSSPQLRDYNPFVGTWHPAVGSVLPFVSAVLGLLLLAVLCWRLAAGSGGAAITGQGAQLCGAAADGRPHDETAPDAAGQEHLAGQRSRSSSPAGADGALR